MNKTSNLKRMYNDLRNGQTVICNQCRIYIRYVHREKRNYIYWECFGRSAERMNLQSLRFICKVIAKSEDIPIVLLMIK